MKLLEYQGKHFLSTLGQPVPKGIVVKTKSEMQEAFAKMGGKAVLKIQTPSGGRGKAGGVILATQEDLADAFFDKWFGREFKGTVVDTFLVQELMDFSQEFYLSIAFNPQDANSIMIFSQQGGMDIETLASESPQSVLKYPLDPLIEYSKEQILEIFEQFCGANPHVKMIAKLAFDLYNIYNGNDLLLLEINPLALLTNGEFKYADVKAEVDDSALFRRPNFNQYRAQPTDELEIEALRIGVNFVRLDGNVGLIASGAGLNMNAMDNIESVGLKAANFLDTGGGITAQMMIDSMKLVSKLPGCRAILFSIYGGVNSLVEAAKGIVAGIEQIPQEIIIAVKVMGNYQEECWKILEDNNVSVFKNHRIEDALVYIKEMLGEI